MTRKHVLPLTYKPKIPAVLEGRCTQTIRAGRRFKVGNLVMFHGWEGQPYRSKWSFRTPYWPIHTVWNITVWKNGILFPEMLEGYDYSPEMFRPWDCLDWLAVLDGIVPETGEELGRVLLEMNELVPTENNLLGELEMQVIRWTFSNEV
ncbi:MAG TPA: hypothetical protein PK955_01380 [Methanoregulaceae archaeon]|nr:hypothetical protein [Methanoregulaceae archaeon]